MAYKIQKAPPEHPGYSWIEPLIAFELHGWVLECDAGESRQEDCLLRAGTQEHITKFR